MVQPGAPAEVGLCLLLAAADGEISDDELAVLTTRVGKLLGEDFPLRELEGVLEGEMEAIAEIGVDAYLEKLPPRILAERRFEALRAACEVACADGLSPEEEEMLRAAGVALDIDVATIVGTTGYKKTLHAGDKDAHEDEPNERTREIAERLLASGWTDPLKELRDAGIGVSGFGALALQYECPNGHLLRLEHHTCDGSLHFHVTDATDNGPDYVIFAEGRELDAVGAIVALQDSVSVETLDQHLPALSRLGRVCVTRDGELVDLAS
jgi:tellurite resistance protein